MNIGIYGGSFDPVHLGHLLVARAAIEELALDRLFFVPAGRSPFKQDAQPAPAAIRMQLLRLALAGKTDCEIDDQEIRRDGPSYAIDTVHNYADRFRGARLFYLIGADNVAQLGDWKDAERLASFAEFFVIPRPGCIEVPFPKPFRGRTLKGHPVEISSSTIRARVKAGLPIDHLVPPYVAKAIRDAKLYV